MDTVFLGPLSLSFPTFLCSPCGLSAPEVWCVVLYYISLLSLGCQRPPLSYLWVGMLCEAVEMPEGRSGFSGGVFAAWMRPLAREAAWDPLEHR